jgi:excinuclease ABC subunit C
VTVPAGRWRALSNAAPGSYLPLDSVFLQPPYASLLSTTAEIQTLSTLRSSVREGARNLPGTYRMMAPEGEVLYVGKAKRIRTRLLSYFRAREGEKAFRVIRGAASLEWSYEPSEFAALLRELELIKRYRPRMNVQHKRDALYSFLKLTGGAAPKLVAVRSVGDDAADYYGPFRGGRRVIEAVRELNDVLGLRDCPLPMPMHFADQPELFQIAADPRCHRLEMRRCAGPCAGRCTAEEYLRRVALARAFLDGDADEPVRWLAERMETAAERWEYEYAATLRDRLGRLQTLRDEFVRLREALDRLTFRYTVRATEGEDRVYLVRRGTVRAVVTRPTTPAGRRRLNRLSAEVFGRPEAGGTLVPRHQVDEILLLARWFRCNPEELANTRAPEESHALPRSA